jgi:hypothetical protein
MQRIFMKKCFLFTVRSVCRIKLFTTVWQRFRYDEEIQRGVQKWLRQQPKDFHAGGFDALVKRWDKRVSVGGGYVEK